MRGLRVVNLVSTALALLLTSALAFGQRAQIADFTYAGAGCPAGSVGSVFDPGQNILTVNFDAFSAWLTGNVRSSRPSNACTLSIVIRVPSGFQLSLNRAQYLGFIDTEPSVSAELRRRYTYGFNPSFSRVETFRRGSRGDFAVTDTFPGWSACQTSVTTTINTRVALRGRASAAGFNEIVVDTAQYQTRLVLYFALAPC